VVTLEGNFYMFNLFYLAQDYEKDRIANDKQNDKEKVLAEAMKIEEEDAEDLLNDLEFEPAFERRTQTSGHGGIMGALRVHKMSSSGAEERKELSSPNIITKNNSAGGFKLNAGFKEMHGNAKRLEIDFEDKVPCNCSVLEVFPVYDGESEGRKEVIFMGTYDGPLLAMSLTTKVDDK
jgi:hypothetical protein